MDSGRSVIKLHKLRGDDNSLRGGGGLGCRTAVGRVGF